MKRGSDHLPQTEANEPSEHKDRPILRRAIVAGALGLACLTGAGCSVQAEGNPSSMSTEHQVDYNAQKNTQEVAQAKDQFRADAGKVIDKLSRSGTGALEMGHPPVDNSRVVMTYNNGESSGFDDNKQTDTYLAATIDSANGSFSVSAIGAGGNNVDFVFKLADSNPALRHARAESVTAQDFTDALADSKLSSPQSADYQRDTERAHFDFDETQKAYPYPYARAIVAQGEQQVVDFNMGEKLVLLDQQTSELAG